MPPTPSQVRVPSLSAESHYIAQACPHWQSSCLSLPRAVIKKHVLLPQWTFPLLVCQHSRSRERPWQPVLNLQLSSGGVASRYDTYEVTCLITWHNLVTGKMGFIFFCTDAGLWLIART